ncbi:hypothetical protein GCM10011504_53360 [Siccirubricoccus deserti]|nr:hypothetical protein GCM10011504_53360 [Siccirubricoccus deserti]
MAYRTKSAPGSNAPKSKGRGRSPTATQTPDIKVRADSWLSFGADPAALARAGIKALARIIHVG